jgi:hypothetical protein
MCFPLAGAHLRAVVVLPPDRAPTVLWWPWYEKDEAAAHLMRTKETSVLCPEPVTRIRPKTITFRSLMAKPEVLQDKTAVCVAHFVDYFTKKTCF